MTITIITVLIVAPIAYLVGGYAHYCRGYDDGLADAERAVQNALDSDLHGHIATADDIASIRWQLTASGEKSIAPETQP